MIEYYTTTGFIKIFHKLFARNLYIMDAFRFVSYSYMNMNYNTPLFVKKKRNTILVDLRPDKETIFKQYKSKTRNEIRRASIENIEFNIENNLLNFISFYNDFASKKDQNHLTYNSFLKLDGLTITKAIQNNKPLVMHAYIVHRDKKITRLINSASCRFEKNANTALIGWANRYLHYKDMLYFKEKKINTYDLGGTAHHTKKKDHHRIAEFKEEFGGETVEEFFYESIPHFLAINFKKLISLF